MAYITYNEQLTDITGSPWDGSSAASLSGVRKGVAMDLVEGPGMPSMVFTQNEIDAAELRADMMNHKIEDVVVTLVLDVTIPPVGTYHGGKSIMIETVRHSYMNNRLGELRKNGEISVVQAYSEETKQIFIKDDVVLSDEPKLPGYGDKKKRVRKGYRD